MIYAPSSNLLYIRIGLLEEEEEAQEGGGKEESPITTEISFLNDKILTKKINFWC